MDFQYSEIIFLAYTDRLANDGIMLMRLKNVNEDSPKGFDTS